MNEITKTNQFQRHCYAYLNSFGDIRMEMSMVIVVSSGNQFDYIILLVLISTFALFVLNTPQFSNITGVHPHIFVLKFYQLISDLCDLFVVSKGEQSKHFKDSKLSMSCLSVVQWFVRASMFNYLYRKRKMSELEIELNRKLGSKFEYSKSCLRHVSLHFVRENFYFIFKRHFNHQS